MKKNANKGFSLVELIIVIAIMAVLVGVLAPQFIKQVEKSRESTDLQNIEEYKTAVETYVAENETADTFSIKLGAAKGTEVTVKKGDAAADLSEYGLASDGKLTLKSKQWDAAFEWEYKDYKWTIKTDASAKYFKLDGSKVE